MNTHYLVLTQMRMLKTPMPTRWCERHMAVLTGREREVVRYVASGLKDREIAQLLVLETGTVKSHMYNVSSKLRVETRTQASMLAVCAGMISKEDTLILWRKYSPEILGPGIKPSAQWIADRAVSMPLREREIVRYAACGLTNNEIVRLLGISQYTVRGLLVRAFDRLGVVSRSQLGMLTIMTGLITPDEVLSIWKQHKPEMFSRDGGTHGVLHRK